MIERAELLAMAKQLTIDELQSILKTEATNRGPGRPKLNNKLEVMSLPLRKDTILRIQELAAERGIRAGAMGRELIEHALTCTCQEVRSEQ